MLKTILRVALLAGFIAAPLVAQAEIIETRTITPGHVHHHDGGYRHHHGWRHHHNNWRHHHHHGWHHHHGGHHHHHHQR